MKCPNCGFENREGAKFCNECGKNLDIVCPECNNVNRPNSKFCDECGYDLSKPLVCIESIGTSQQSAILPDKPEQSICFEGERRQATVVFSDLSGYTAMSEQLDPEDVENIMGRIKKKAVNIVERYGGIVNQFVGDEILALFGIPTAHEDDPLRAVKASLELHKMVRQMSPEVEDRIGKPITMHTGINTGLIVTSLRDNRDGLYGITGETVNTGARLKLHAGPDEILASPETMSLIGPYFETVAIEKIKMKGKTESMAPYKITGESKIHTRIEVSEQKGFTPYTGRETELDILNGCLDKAIKGEGQFVTIVGEAGAGKSRLHYELRHRLDREKITVLQGWCQSYGNDIPYLPLIDGLRRGLNLKEGQSPKELLDKAVRNIKLIDPSLERFIPLYLHLLSIPSEFHLPENLQGKELREALEEALSAIITQNTQHAPMVLILEDWHWSDDASQSALLKLIGVAASFPLMLVVTYRPVYQTNWGYTSHHTQVVLRPFDVLNTEKIIKSVTKVSMLPEGLGKLIHERTNGNPLFIEEVCYSLIEDGVMVVEDKNASITKSLSKLSLPDTVQSIIRSRLDRLDRESKEAIRLASVIGRVFGQRILEKIYSAHFELSKSLETLKSLDVIQQTRVLPEAEFTFRHVMTQSVVYETLLLQQRKELHGSIGKAIEELYSERLEEQAPILSYHYSRSDQHDKAVEYALLAGDQATRLYANKEATVYYEQAFSAAKKLHDSIKSQKWQIDAGLKLATVGITRQDIERDLRNLEEVRVLAESINDERSLAKIFYWLGRIHYVLWSPQVAMEYAEKSLIIADSLEDDSLAASPVNLMGRVYYQLSDFRKASQFLERNVEQMRRIGNKVEESTASALTGYLFAFLGKFDQAFEYADNAIQLANKIENPFAKANGYHLRGCVCDQRGEWKGAIKDYDKAIYIAEKAEDLFRLYLVKSWKGRAHVMIEELSLGRKLLEESLTLAEKIGTKFWLAWQKTALADCLFRLGEIEAGSTLCQEAISLGEETKDKYVIAFAKRTFAEMLCSPELIDPEKSDLMIHSAINVLQEIDAKPEIARSYMSYANILAGKGVKDMAQKYLTKAMGMFQNMSMTWDLAQLNQLQHKFRMS